MKRKEVTSLKCHMYVYIYIFQYLSPLKRLKTHNLHVYGQEEYSISQINPNTVSFAIFPIILVVNSFKIHLLSTNRKIQFDVDHMGRIGIIRTD